MTVTKGEITYAACERTKVWSVKRKVDKLEIEIRVDKALAGTFDELKEYILKNEIFK